MVSLIGDLLGASFAELYAAAAIVLLAFILTGSGGLFVLSILLRGFDVGGYVN